MAERNELVNDPEAAMRAALDGRQAQMWTAMPAIVTAVNLAKMTLTCRPAIQGVITDENGVTRFVDLPLLDDVPIVFPGSGGFLITLPIAVDDEVLVVFSSRCIDSWWEQGSVGKPMESRMHDLSDAFALPGPRSLPNVAPAISTTGLQIRNNAGTTFIELSADGKIRITGDVVVTGTVVANGISLTSHVHPGVQPGPSNTGGPI